MLACWIKGKALGECDEVVLSDMERDAGILAAQEWTFRSYMRRIYGICRDSPGRPSHWYSSDELLQALAEQAGNERPQKRRRLKTLRRKENGFFHGPAFQFNKVRVCKIVETHAGLLFGNHIDSNSNWRRALEGLLERVLCPSRNVRLERRETGAASSFDAIAAARDVIAAARDATAAAQKWALPGITSCSGLSGTMSGKEHEQPLITNWVQLQRPSPETLRAKLELSYAVAVAEDKDFRRHWNSRTQSEKFPDAYEQRRICSFSGMYVCKPRPPQLHITDKGNVWCCLPERKPTEREVAEKAAAELTHWRKLGEEHTCALPKDRDRRVCVHSPGGFWSLAYTDTNLQNEPVPCPCNRCDEFHKRGKLLPCIPCFHEAAWHGATSHLEAAEKEAMYKAADLEELRMVCITIMIICDDNNILRAYDKGLVDDARALLQRLAVNGTTVDVSFRSKPHHAYQKIPEEFEDVYPDDALQALLLKTERASKRGLELIRSSPGETRNEAVMGCTFGRGEKRVGQRSAKRRSPQQ